MVTNNEAVENFLNGKRNLAAYQFSQLIRETTSQRNRTPLNSVESDQVAASSSHQTLPGAGAASQPVSDEIAFNYAMINLFTGCPQRASLIFNDLVERYPRNPRLWLRLAESMLATERAKLGQFEHVQQLAYPHSRDHLIKTKNKPILIKINPNYCQQQIQQQFHLQRGISSNFLVTIKGYLQKSLELINEYNDISLLTDDVPTSNSNSSVNHGQQASSNATMDASSIGHNTINSSIASTSSPSLVGHNSSINSEHSLLDSNQRSKLSQHLSYSNPYHSISRSDLYHLRNKVQLNLAYVCLCMGEPNRALEYTTQCLRSSPLGYEKILANLYHAEACILASKIDEAIHFLNLEILNMAKGLSSEHPAVKGDTKQRVVYGDEMRRQLESGALATVVTYNLSVAYSAKGELGSAYKILMKSFEPTKPNPLQIIICLLYIQLQQGQLESAKRTILNNLPQFR